ncbi:spinster family MFS transporter [Aurantiacibacter gangjinensis]|uniref:MFS transporter n=1 Tax=Aurantiacibacter gangjinensis TaxID=502682 RepID=A0A0G9MRG2_9SPHN|nr:MFS transporter [Aurantiacibacter gangjinensis]APE29037.1 L-Proline/Glycine betaine transporter ProP [Aurantiacibacter gangjinensis]KLE33134.1 MFS transporter [Aurantiacibacter gangjinensis]
MSREAVASRPDPKSGTVLGMLLVVYIFNFVDRQILSILAAPIQAELELSDGEMGLLGGLAFALLYSTMAVPLAALADRTSRSWVIAVSLFAWSGFTALCGLAQNFWHIFLARLGVGIGESGGVAPSYALIGDYFPSEKRATALSIYSLGIPIGSGLGVLLGGYIAATINWRTAFFVVGLAGVFIVPLFKYLVRDKAKSKVAAGNPSPLPQAPRLAETARILSRKPSFWFLSFGAAMSSMMGYGIAFWLPSLLIRSFGFDLVEASRFFGAILLLGGVAGVLAGGLLADRLGGRDKAFYAWLPAVAFFLGAPLFAIGILSTDWKIAFVVFLLPQALAYIWLGPVLSAIQHLVNPAARSTASALFLLINNLIGLGGGIYALGALSDFLAPTYGDEALRYSMLYALVLYGIAAVLMALAGPFLRKDWVRE